MIYSALKPFMMEKANHDLNIISRAMKECMGEVYILRVHEVVMGIRFANRYDHILASYRPGIPPSNAETLYIRTDYLYISYEMIFSPSCSDVDEDRSYIPEALDRMMELDPSLKSWKMREQ